MKKLPSISTLWNNTRSVVVRFPLAFLITAIAVITWWLAINSATGDQVTHLYKLLVLCNLAFCLSLAIDLFSEAKIISAGKRWVLQFLAILFCGILFFVLAPEWFEADIYKLVTFIVAGHLLVSFLPFSRKADVHSFWQYNKFLFLRFFTAVLYSSVLFVGLTIALSSIKNLFNIPIDGDIYLSLFAFMSAGFNTLFFLAGIPSDLNSFEKDFSYPKGLKVFTQYVLIPLLTVYLAILLIYEFKIIFDQELPEGMVSILIMGYATFGILSYLLIYPIRNEKNNEWTKTFSKLFFIFMIPLLILLCVAVWVRVADYSITEPRYFLILLTVWLSGITLYFLINKSPNIQLIPISLCLMALLSTFGPQSASSIAKNSQLARYKQLGTDNKSEEEKASIIRYMVGHYGLSALQSLTEADLVAIENNIVKSDTLNTVRAFENKNELVDTAYSILKIRPLFHSSFLSYYSIQLADKVVDVSEYDYIVDFQSYSVTKEILSPSDTVRIEHITNKNQIKIQLGNDSTVLALSPFYKSLEKEILTLKDDSYKMDNNDILLPETTLKIDAELANYRFSLVFKSLSISKEVASVGEDKIDNSFNGVLLIRKKE
ncbi:MAG TPA: DUF4153 domain-containing protein [Sphingobacteriaceae bacterium]|nr:DUF4153 domain-containing protein [Sphingobacteriaceae bacterium]